MEFCCSGLPGAAGCFNNHHFTHKRCCVMAEALKDYLRKEEPRPGHLHAFLGPLLPRYNINETLWNQRRMRLRHGRHNAACEILPPPPDILDGLNEDDKEVERENGLLGAYEVLLEAGVASRQVFQVGVEDGKSGDPVYQLIMQRGVGGLGIEALPDDVSRARQNRPPRFRVEQAYITAANVWYWARQLEKIDVVVIDIDTFECPVLEALLDGAIGERRQLPALLNLEINMLVPPPFKFSRGYGLHDARLWAQQYSTTSCSLSYAIRSFSSRGYELLTFGYDAIFVRRDLTPLYSAVRPALKFPQDEFLCYRRSVITTCSRPIRFVREWFFRANDPTDLHLSLESMWRNITQLSEFEGMKTMPFSLFI